MSTARLIENFHIVSFGCLGARAGSRPDCNPQLHRPTKHDSNEYNHRNEMKLAPGYTKKTTRIMRLAKSSSTCQGCLASSGNPSEVAIRDQKTISCMAITRDVKTLYHNDNPLVRNHRTVLCSSRRLVDIVTAFDQLSLSQHVPRQLGKVPSDRLRCHQDERSLIVPSRPSWTGRVLSIRAASQLPWSTLILLTHRG